MLRKCWADPADLNPCILRSRRRKMRSRKSKKLRMRDADVLRPLSSDHPDDETFEGLLIVRSEGRLFFLNAQNVADRIRALAAEYRPRAIALDMSRVPDLEYSALPMLKEAVDQRAPDGPEIWLVGLTPACWTRSGGQLSISSWAVIASCSMRGRRSSARSFTT
jgi:MFS superfamily sulfate permease-like transporter